MPFSPLVSKIRCHNPNKKGSKMANRNYLTYIATREGVDISNVKDINDLLENNNIVKSELNDDYVHMEADNAKYLKYIAERPRSHGLFGNIDTTDLGKIAKQVSDLTEQRKCIYRGIISLSQNDAEELGFTNKKQWDIYMKKVMPDIAKELGVSITNFTWVAAYHAEKSHPHVHYELWDNTDKVKSPFIHTSVQHKCRQLLSDAAFDKDYENMIKEIYKSERDELNKIRNDSRRVLTDTTKNIMSDLDIYVPGLKKDTLTDRISIDEANILANELIKLVDILPVHGSTDYAYLNSEIKSQVNEITSLLLKRFDMNKEFKSYIKAVEDGQKIIGKTKFEINIAREKAEKDIMNRIGNVIIKKAKSLKEFANSIDNTITTSYENSNINDSRYFSDIEAHENESDIINKDYFEITNELYDIPEENELYHNPSNDNIKETFYYAWNDDYKNSLKYLYDKKEQNFDLALSLLEKEADKNNVLAIHDLGKLYERGVGVEINADRSNEYYNRSLKGFLNIEKQKPNKYIEYRIGKLYDSGKGLERDYEKAVRWYEKSTAQNYKYSQYSLGMLYLHGKGIDKSGREEYYNSKALQLFDSSAKQDNAYAAFELGKMYDNGIGTNTDKETANKYYKQAFQGFLNMETEREDDNLMYRIGKMYYDGIGVNKDEDKAIEYFVKAAKLNNVNAQYILAKIYLKSNDSNKEDAIKILNKLAKSNNDMAQYQLGKLYYEGKEVEGDINKAIKMLKLSAENGNNQAQYLLGKLYADKKLEQYNILNAEYWYLKASENGNQFAQYNLGKLYYEGKEIEQDIEKGIKYILASAKQGNSFAEYTLGKIYEEQEPGHYSMEAISWYEKSAKHGNQFAQYQLGKIYSDKESKYYDISAAIFWYEKSADQGNQFAQFQLGRRYLFGKDVSKDEVLGKYWLHKAIEQGNEYALNTLNMYDRYKDQIAPGASYELVKLIFNMMSNEKQKSSWNVDKKYRSRSKQAIKEEAMRQQIQGQKYDNYME